MKKDRIIVVRARVEAHAGLGWWAGEGRDSPGDRIRVARLAISYTPVVPDPAHAVLTSRAPRRGTRARRRMRFALRVLPLFAVALGSCELDTQAAAENESILALFRQPAPAEAARWAVDPHDPDKRYRGTALLAAAPFGGEDAYLTLYREYVADPESSVRAVAIRALGRHGSPEDVGLIVPALEDEDRLVRFEAARALQRLHNEAAAEPLTLRLDPRTEPESDVRAEAANALAQYAQTRVVQALISALSDDQLAVSHSALVSLQTLTGQNLPEDPAAWKAWFDAAPAPFAGQRAYTYPAFSRDKYFFEYLPLVPPPPNEIATAPVGMPEIPGAGEAGGSSDD